MVEVFTNDSSVNKLKEKESVSVHLPLSAISLDPGGLSTAMTPSHMNGR